MRKTLIAIAKPLIGATIAIIIVAKWALLTPLWATSLAFFLVVVVIRAIRWSTNLLVSALCSWWCRKRWIVAIVGILILSGAALIFALMNDCRYPCQQWQSTGFDLLATIAGFWVGMIIAAVLKPLTMSRKEWVQTAIGFIALLVAPTLQVFIPDFPNAAAIFIWTLGLPVLGEAAKHFWPQIFETAEIGSRAGTPQTHAESD